jgi:SAM-dependent methyltransferase
MSDEFLEKQATYWDTLACSIPDDVAKNHWVDRNGRPLDRRLFREIALFLGKEFLHERTDGEILEIGCGTGLVLGELSALLGCRWRLSGVDVSEEMLRRVPVRDVRLYRSDARRIPCEAQQFDLIYAHSVVQYFDNESYLRQVIAECLRTLKTGGSLCFLDVPLAWYQELMVRNDLVARLRRRFGAFAGRSLGPLSRLYRARRERISETIAGVQVSVPSFRGYYADPDLFMDYVPSFGRVSIEVQPFEHKPINYRKFRFNVLMKRKTSPPRAAPGSPATNQ